MAKSVSFEGTVYQFPDDATDAEIASALSAQPQAPSKAPNLATSVIDGVRSGVAGLISGPAATIEQLTGADTSRSKAVASKIAPENHTPASFARDGAAAIPGMVAEGLPGLGVDMTAATAGAKLAGRGGKAGLAGAAAAALSYMLRTRGSAAEENAQYRTGDQNAKPEAQDIARSWLTGVPEAALNSASLGVGGVAARTAKQGLKNFTAKTAAEAGTEATQDVIGQVGKGIGTDKGVQIDTNSIIDAAVGGGATRATIAAPRLAGDALAQRKYAEFDDKNTQAAEEVADMARTLSGGDSLSNTRTSLDTLKRVEGRVRKDIRTAAKGYQLGADELDIVDRAGKGQKLTDTDLDMLAQVDPQLSHLARKAHVAAMIRDLGHVGNKRFTGGMFSAAQRQVHALAKPGLAGAGGAAIAMGLDPHAISMFAYKPETVAALAGAGSAMYGIDKLTGNRSPLNQFVQRYETGRTNAPPASPTQPLGPPQGTVTPTQPQAPAAPAAAAPWGPRPTLPHATVPPVSPRAFTTVPPVQAPQPHTTAQPWGPEAPAPTPETPVDPIGDTRAMLKRMADEAAYLAKVRKSSTPAEEPAAPAPAAPATLDADTAAAVKRMMAFKAQEAKANETAEQKAARAAAAEAARVQKAQRDAAKASAAAEKARVKAEKEQAKLAALAEKALNAKKAKSTAQAVGQPVASPAAPEPARQTVKLVPAGRDKYSITNADGKEIAAADIGIVVIDGKKLAQIDDFYTPALENVTNQAEHDAAVAASRNTLGPGHLREVMRQFLAMHPDVQGFTGNRVSGARSAGVMGPGNIHNVTVPLPEPTVVQPKAVDVKPALRLAPDDLDIPEFLRRTRENPEPALKMEEPKKADVDVGDYTRLTPDQRWGEGLDDGTWADAEIERMGNIDPDKKKRYRANIIHDRQSRKRVIIDVLSDYDVTDQEIGVDLLEELHHTRRAAQAKKAIEDFTRDMSPEAAAALKKRMDASWINSIWEAK
jgi:hypothetical protein